MNDTQRHTQTPEQERRAEELAALIEQLDPEARSSVIEFMEILTIAGSNSDAPAEVKQICERMLERAGTKTMTIEEMRGYSQETRGALMRAEEQESEADEEAAHE